MWPWRCSLDNRWTHYFLSSYVYFGLTQGGNENFKVINVTMTNYFHFEEDHQLFYDWISLFSPSPSYIWERNRVIGDHYRIIVTRISNKQFTCINKVNLRKEYPFPCESQINQRYSIKKNRMYNLENKCVTWGGIKCVNWKKMCKLEKKMFNLGKYV